MQHDSYYHSKTDRRRVSQRGPMLFLSDVILGVVSVVMMVLVALLLLVPHIDPAYTWAFPMLGLVAPAIYMLALFMMLYWVVRWRLRRACAMTLFLMLGLFSIDLFWRPASHRATLLEQQLEQVDRQIAETDNERDLYTLRRRRRLLMNNLTEGNGVKVMTFNLRAFYGDDGKSSADQVAKLLDSLQPDILCLQEYASGLATRSDAFQRLLEKYQVASFGLDDNAPRYQMILSRFKILRSGVITTQAASVWADLLLDDDTVRVVSNHLKSTGITSLDNAYLTHHEYLLDTAREEKLRSIVDRFHKNCVVRADQVDSIRRHIDHEAPALRIICGDFNDTPVSYTYRKLAKGMQDAFSECGSGYSYTFRGFYNLLRIDYVLLSKGLECVAYEVPEVELSDHLPIVVRFEKQTTY